MIGILTDIETGDLLLSGRSLIIGEVSEQVAQSVIVASQGEFKEHPLIGADLQRLINGNGDPFWSANAKQMLHACGIVASKVSIVDNQITIE